VQRLLLRLLLLRLLNTKDDDDAGENDGARG
jgi:hypothetical protein